MENMKSNNTTESEQVSNDSKEKTFRAGLMAGGVDPDITSAGGVDPD
jgi:hypothetical protein